MVTLVPLLKGIPGNLEYNESKVYVIQFPSPFNPKLEKADKKITYKEARKNYFKVFKTTSKQELAFNKKPKEDQKKKDESFIPDMIKSNVPWLYDEKIPAESTLPVKEYLAAIISGILFTIKYELNLNYTLLESRDQDEIFCEIYAKEEWLEGKAQIEEYRLQFKTWKDDKTDLHIYPFKEVLPFAKFEVPENSTKEEVRKLFRQFDHNENEVDNGSLFVYNDKVRLVRSSLNSRLDLHTMKELRVSIEDFCIHSEEPLKELKSEWANFRKIFSSQPLTKIKNYFGEKAGLYFAWMETYKNFMITAAAVGTIVQILVFIDYNGDSDNSVTLKSVSQVFFAIFLALWASTFDQLWTRKEKVFAWKWGTTSFYEEEEQRGEFKGKMFKDPVTNKMKRQTNNKVWHKLQMFLSYSVIFVFIVCVGGIISSILILRYILSSDGTPTIWSYLLSGVLNAIQIRVMNLLYDRIAVLLNDWENHETETIYNNQLAVKSFIFKFVNSYSTLFYLAYFKGDFEICGDGACMNFLSIQLAIIFLLSILLNFIELLVPWLLMKRRIISEDLDMQKLQKDNPTIRTDLYAVEKEAKCESYESPLEDYIEMIIEFGYIVIFGTALPILPLILLIEIYIEIRVDSWKMCNICKRADPNRSEDIGVFKDIIVAIAYMGSVNNAGIIVYTSGIFKDWLESDYSGDYWKVLVAFVILEHTLILAMFLISVIVPDEPEVVKNGLVWSERIINERLYKTGGAKTDSAKFIVDDRLNSETNTGDFILTESKIKYDE